MLGTAKQTLSYFLVGIISLAAAVYVSSIWLKPAESAVPKGLLAQNAVPAPAAPAQVVPSLPQQVTQSGSLDPAQAFLEPYLYDTREGRRNPFKPATFIEAGALSNQMAGPSTPLERFELDELRLLAIIWDVKSPRAMFLDPTNEVHTVTKDDRIGRRRGYIAVIREGEVVVVESTTYGGEAVYSTRILRMER